MDSFIKEILSLREIENIKAKNYEDEHKKWISTYRNFSHYRMQEQPLRSGSLGNDKLKRLGSIKMPREGMEQLIWKSALDIASNCIIVSDSSDLSSESEEED